MSMTIGEGSRGKYSLEETTHNCSMCANTRLEYGKQMLFILVVFQAGITLYTLAPQQTGGVYIL